MCGYYATIVWGENDTHPRISIDCIFEILGIKKPCWCGKLRYLDELSTTNQQGENMITKTVLPFNPKSADWALLAGASALVDST
jgi:hypothetical protein